MNGLEPLRQAIFDQQPASKLDIEEANDNISGLYFSLWDMIHDHHLLEKRVRKLEHRIAVSRKIRKYAGRI